MRQDDYEKGVVFTPHQNDPTPKRRKAVRCVETGEVFHTMREASVAKTGKEEGNMKRAIKTGQKFAGFHWEFITPC